MKPRFIVLAGPNGAGKTSHGHQLTGGNVPIFNGDLVYAELLEKYPFYDREKLKGGVPARLDIEKQEALAHKTDFAFETNYSTEMAIELSEEFSNNGYETHLIYFGLNDLYQSVARVNQRVEAGGHDVPLSGIKFNFEMGIKKVKENLRLYDQVHFIDTSTQDIIILANLDFSQNEFYLQKEPAEWFDKYFKTTFMEIVRNPEVTIKNPERSQGYDTGFER